MKKAHLREISLHVGDNTVADDVMRLRHLPIKIPLRNRRVVGDPRGNYFFKPPASLTRFLKNLNQ